VDPVATTPPLPRSFYARPVVDVARDLVGCVVSHGETAGVIVETEAYHESEPASHSYGGLTARSRPLFGQPGHAYVYRSYGIHALLNAVCDVEGVGAAVLIRALEPAAGLDTMRARRRLQRPEDLCSGPGKLTQALDVELDLNEADLTTGPILIASRPPEWQHVELIASTRIGITKAVELPWRFSARGSRSVSKPWPKGLLAVK
jgi:DNA-3-methyladenine glycosylase